MSRVPRSSELSSCEHPSINQCAPHFSQGCARAATTISCACVSVPTNASSGVLKRARPADVLPSMQRVSPTSGRVPNDPSVVSAAGKMAHRDGIRRPIPDHRRSPRDIRHRTRLHHPILPSPRTAGCAALAPGNPGTSRASTHDPHLQSTSRSSTLIPILAMHPRSRPPPFSQVLEAAYRGSGQARGRHRHRAARDRDALQSPTPHHPARTRSIHDPRHADCRSSTWRRPLRRDVAGCADRLTTRVIFNYVCLALRGGCPTDPTDIYVVRSVDLVVSQSRATVGHDSWDLTRRRRKIFTSWQLEYCWGRRAAVCAMTESVRLFDCAPPLECCSSGLPPR